MADGMVGSDRMVVPDLTEPLIAFRTWDLREGRLIGPFKYEEWSLEMTARCAMTHPPHDRSTVPDEKCACGLYGYFKLDGDGSFPGTKGKTMQVPIPFAFGAYTLGHVIGAISCQGRIGVHETGIRAQRAKVLCLVRSRDGEKYAREKGSTLKEVAGFYEIPLVPLRRMREYAEDFGTPVPEQILDRVRKMNRERGAGWERKYTQKGLRRWL